MSDWETVSGPNDESGWETIPPAKPTFANRAGTVGAGFNRGTAGILGLPVDTLLNLWDMGKAATGVAQSKITGEAPSSVFDPADRSQYALSSEWISNIFNKSPATTTVAPGPQDEASKYLYAGGSALPGVMIGRPSTMGQAATSTVANVAPALAATAAGEKFKGTPYENTAPILASLTTSAAPYALQGGIKAVAQNTIGRNVDDSTKRAARVLEDAGVELDNSQTTGKLKTTKASLNDNPFMAAGQAKKIERQRGQFTRAALRTIGEEANAATPEVMARAKDRIGSTISDISERTPVKFTTDFYSNLDNVVKEASRSLTDADLGVLQKQIDHLQSKAQASQNGVWIDGKTMQGTRSELGGISSNGGMLGHFAGKLQSVVDDAIQANAKGDDYSNLKIARQQYRAQLQITPTIDKQGDGMISPSRLVNSLSSGTSGKNQFYYGRGDQTLVDLAKAGSKLLVDRVPNSGTPMRMMRQALPGAAYAAGAGLLSGNPVPAAAVATGYFGIPKVQQQIVDNRALLTPMSIGENELQRMLLLQSLMASKNTEQR